VSPFRVLRGSTGLVRNWDNRQHFLVAHLVWAVSHPPHRFSFKASKVRRGSCNAPADAVYLRRDPLETLQKFRITKAARV
jgi:hypothetical protein